MLITYPHAHYLSVWVPLAAGSLSARRPRVLVTYPPAYFLSANEGTTQTGSHAEHMHTDYRLIPMQGGF